MNRYKNDNLTRNEASQIILQLNGYPSTDLYESNKTIKVILNNSELERSEEYYNRYADEGTNE